jgi:hypothetical protein
MPTRSELLQQIRERGSAAIEAAHAAGHRLARPLMWPLPPAAQANGRGIRWMLVSTATAIGVPCILAMGEGEPPISGFVWWVASRGACEVVLLDRPAPRRGVRPRIERVESVGDPDAAAFLDTLFSPAERDALLRGDA